MAQSINEGIPNWKTSVEAAAVRIQPFVRWTPLEFSPVLSAQGQAKVHIKLENDQITGSFKVRGAFNKVILLKEKNRNLTPITASTGNHALACTLAFQKLDITGTIFVPTIIAKGKEDLLKLNGAKLCHFGTDCIEGETEARKTAQEQNQIFISPYNDLEIVAGQGTIGLEILSDLAEVDAVLVSVGGGGLIGGIAAYVKTVKPSVKIIGVQPKASKVMYESIVAGKIIEEESYETLSDGTAGGVEQDAVTFALCRDYVDDWLLIDEESIAKGIYFMLEHHHKVVEGAAGMAVAAYMDNKERFRGQNVAIVSCGANIGMDKLRHIINIHST